MHDARGGGVLYDIELVRTLCREIGDEQDPDKAAELASFLQAVLKEDHEEIRVRMAFLARNYASVITKAAD